MTKAGMFLELDTLASPVNFYVLPDLPDIKLKQTKGHSELCIHWEYLSSGKYFTLLLEGISEFKGIPDYDYLMERFRAQLLAIPRHPLCSTVTGEKSWYKLPYEFIQHILIWCYSKVDFCGKSLGYCSEVLDSCWIRSIVALMLFLKSQSLSIDVVEGNNL